MQNRTVAPSSWQQFKLLTALQAKASDFSGTHFQNLLGAAMPRHTEWGERADLDDCPRLVEKDEI
ncbi:MAG: hypothetical protein ABT04_00785 [Granulicella sp. SCN 62-9]|nr:MAG: hypothetical protein ABT04_00785 [Granulicella sp. SCN 62-9]